MRSPAELSDINIFFNYGSLDLGLETEHDVYLGLVQPGKSLFYDRQDAADIGQYENDPTGLTLQVMLKYAVMQWNNYRNLYTDDGTVTGKDRRVAMSQDYITVTAPPESGNIDLEVLYIPYTDYMETKATAAQIGIPSLR